VFSILVVYSFGVRWFFGNEGNQPTFLMKHRERGRSKKRRHTHTKKRGEHFVRAKPKKKIPQHNTQHTIHYDDDYEKR